MEASVKGQVQEIQKFSRTKSEIPTKLIERYLANPYKAVVVKQRTGENAIIIESNYEV